jgi:hypothetical protein
MGASRPRLPDYDTSNQSQTYARDGRPSTASRVFEKYWQQLGPHVRFLWTEGFDSEF